MSAAASATDPAVASAVAQAVQETSAQFDALLDLINLLWRFKAYLCAALALLGWDILVTMRAEYNLFWRQKIGVASFGFTFLRYWSLATLATYTGIFFSHYSHETCSRLHWILPIMAFTSFSAAQFMIGLRVWAVWNMNRLVLLLFLSAYATGLSLQIWTMHDNTYVPFPAGVPGCVDSANPNNHTFWVFWVSPLLFDATAIGLTLIKVFQRYRSGGVTPLVVLIVRDEMLYFLCVFAMNLLNTVWFKSSRADHALHTSMSIALTSVLVSRMYINLKSSSTKPSNHVIPSGSYPLSYRSADVPVSPPVVNVASLDLPEREKEGPGGKQEERGSFDYSV